MLSLRALDRDGKAFAMTTKPERLVGGEIVKVLQWSSSGLFFTSPRMERLWSECLKVKTKAVREQMRLNIRRARAADPEPAQAAETQRRDQRRQQTQHDEPVRSAAN